MRIRTSEGTNRRLKKTDWKLHNLYSSVDINGDKVKEEAMGGACIIPGFEDGHIARMSG